MLSRTVGIGAVAALVVLALAVPCAHADDRGVVGTKLVIVDNLATAGKAKLVFVSKDGTPGAIHKGPASDPPMLSGAVSVFPLSDATGNRAEFALDDGADGVWLVDKYTVAKYVNKAAGPGALGVKVAVVKPDKVLKVVAKTLGDGDAASGDDGPLDLDAGAIAAGDVMRVVVSLTVPEGNGLFTTHRMCADFTDLIVKSIAGGTGTKIVSKTSTAPSDCDDVTSVTTTTTISSTTTTTFAGTCDPFTQNCPSGQGCYPTTSGGTTCLPAGSGGPGNGCVSSGQCGIGLFCGPNAICETICEVGGAPTCPSGSSCTPYTGSLVPNFGFCSTLATTTTTSSTTTTTLTGTCNPFTQNCPSGQGCYPTTSGGVACFPAGSGGEGAPCTQNLVCGIGLVCYVTSSGGTCREICQVGGTATCPSGTACTAYPLASVPDFGACVASTTTTTTSSTTSTTLATCDVFLQNCPSGQGCYPTLGSPPALCTTAGSGTQGSFCFTSTDCAAGYVCLTTGSCVEMCNTTAPSTCPGITFCQAISGTGITNFGVCF